MDHFGGWKTGSETLNLKKPRRTLRHYRFVSSTSIYNYRLRQQDSSAFKRNPENLPSRIRGIENHSIGIERPVQFMALQHLIVSSIVLLKFICLFSFGIWRYKGKPVHGRQNKRRKESLVTTRKAIWTALSITFASYWLVGAYGFGTKHFSAEKSPESEEV